jgi:hypothetical protein
VKAYDLRTRVSVTFATDSAAKNFYEITRGGISIDVDGEDTLIYTKKDRSIESRITQKAVGELWKMCGDAFKDSDQWTREHEIGSTGVRGQLYARKDEDVWPLFETTSADDGGIDIAPQLDNLAKWGIDSVKAQNFVLAAKTKVAALRRA